jgi:hypothetical protein
MSNPNPVNPFPKNRKVRVGRKPGVPNNFTRELKEALLDAAEEVGEVEEEEILDKDGNSTGKFRRKATGKAGSRATPLHRPRHSRSYYSAICRGCGCVQSSMNTTSVRLQ